MAQDNHARGVSNFPQKALKFLFDMGPDGLTSPGCLRAGQCLPLGGQSVWGTMGTLDTSKVRVLTRAGSLAACVWVTPATATEAGLYGCKDGRECHVS